MVLRALVIVFWQNLRRNLVIILRFLRYWTLGTLRRALTNITKVVNNN